MEHMAEIAGYANKLLQEAALPRARPGLLLDIPAPPPLRLATPPPLQQQSALFDELQSGALASINAIYTACCEGLARRYLDTYATSSTNLNAAFVEGEHDQHVRWQEVLCSSLSRSFEEATRRAAQRILDEVRAAQLRHSLSPPAPPSPESSPPTGRPKQFTAEVLAILEAAFEASDSVSRGERRELANVTGLTERQVLTWVRTAPTLPLEEG